MTASEGELPPADAVAAGHICIDLFPALPRGAESGRYEPGTLADIGPLQLAAGGSVSNTGMALHRLGVRTRLLGKIGDDPLGSLLRETIGEVSPNLTDGLLVVPGDHTSYSIILSPPQGDRTVLHFPGANDTFTAADIPPSRLQGARVFHFGYPPIMRHMYGEDGAGLLRVMRLAGEAGLVTVLDAAYPDPDGPAGQVDWERILATALPAVDAFLPSLAETWLMLEPERARAALHCSLDELVNLSAEEIAALAARLLVMGAGVIGIKAGERGLYLRTGSRERLGAMAATLGLDLDAWSDRELWSPVYEVTVAGTTGAGDATNAGFVFGLLQGMTPEDAISAACAVGAASVEATDATSAIPSWPEIESRMARGWRQKEMRPGPGWTRSLRDGIWYGTQDRGPRSS